MKIFNWAKKKLKESHEFCDTLHLQADEKSAGAKMPIGISENLDERSILAIGTLGTQILIESGHKEGEYWDYLQAEVVQLPPATIVENGGLVLDNQHDQSCGNNRKMFKELAIDNAGLRSSSITQSPNSEKTHFSLSPSDNRKEGFPATKKNLLRRFSDPFIPKSNIIYPCPTLQAGKINETCEEKKFWTSYGRIGADKKSNNNNNNNSSSMKNMESNGAPLSGSTWPQHKSRLPKLLKAFRKRKKSQVVPDPIGHSSKQHPTSYNESNEGSQTPKYEVDTQYDCYSTKDNINIELELVNKHYYEYHMSQHHQDNQQSMNNNVIVQDDNIHWLINNSHEYWINTDEEYVVLEF